MIQRDFLQDEVRVARGVTWEKDSDMQSVRSVNDQVQSPSFGKFLHKNCSLHTSRAHGAGRIWTNWLLIACWIYSMWKRTRGYEQSWMNGAPAQLR